MRIQQLKPIPLSLARERFRIGTESLVHQEREHELARVFEELMERLTSHSDKLEFFAFAFERTRNRETKSQIKHHFARWAFG